MNYESSEFRLSLIAYINYINRQMKKNPDYTPHPLVRAIYGALEGMESHKNGAVLMGVSGEKDEKDRSQEAYIVVLRKDDDHAFTLLNVHEAVVKQDVPVEAAMQLLLLSMRLDKHEGPDVPVDAAIEIVNDTIPSLQLIKFDNSKWKEARDGFKKHVQEGKVVMQEGPETEKMIEEFMTIRENTPWEEYPSIARVTIGQYWVSTNTEVQADKNPIVITSVDDVVQKYKVMRMVRENLFGWSAEFLNQVSRDKDDQHQPGFSNVGRNSPCPCGSGEKYKKCCGRDA